MFALAATAAATARFPRHHALKHSALSATPLATVVAVAVAVNLDTASDWPHVLTLNENKMTVQGFNVHRRVTNVNKRG